MIVHFIGAGPGAPDLITLRGLHFIKKSPVCLYAGSLVPQEIINLSQAKKIINTATMTLEEIITEIKKASLNNQDVARLHSGDLSLYSAISEQIRCLKSLKIKYDITPGISAYSAACSDIGTELTLPKISQTIILTRTTVRSSNMPVKEDLSNLAKIGATLIIHLSINNLMKIVEILIPHYGNNCPVIIAYRVSWPDAKYLIGTLNTIREKVKKNVITRTALIMVGEVFGKKDFQNSHLYNPNYSHILRRKKK